MKSGEFLQRMTRRFDLPPETLGRDSQVLLSGRHQVTVEGHRGIRHYGSERIEVRALHGVVAIDGAGLQVAFLSAERLCIRGTIRVVTVEGSE